MTTRERKARRGSSLWFIGLTGFIEFRKFIEFMKTLTAAKRPVWVEQSEGQSGANVEANNRALPISGLASYSSALETL